MPIRIASFTAVPARVNDTTSASRPEAPTTPSRDALFADGFSNRVAAPVSLGTPEPVVLPQVALDVPAFKPGNLREIMARNYATDVAEAPEAEDRGPVQSLAERIEQANKGAESLNGFRELGEDVNLDADARAGALDILNRDIEQYSRVAPNLTGERQTYAQNLIESAEANRAEIEALPEFTDTERAAGGFAQAVEDSPLASSAFNALESPAVRGLGIGAGAIGAYFEGEELLNKGDDVAMASAGAVSEFGFNVAPGTQGLAAFDALTKLGVEGASAGLEAATGLGDTERSEEIYCRGVFTDTVVDGARAVVGLGEAALTGDTSELDNFRDTIDNGSLFERSLGAVGNLIGATAAAVTTGSTQPFTDFAEDTQRSFGTLGQGPQKSEQPQPAEDYSNPFTNYETPAVDTTELPSYTLNGPEPVFGESYGQDFVPDYAGGGGGGAGGHVFGEDDFDASEN